MAPREITATLYPHAAAAAAEHNGLKLNQTGVNVQKMMVQSECLDFPA